MDMINVDYEKLKNPHPLFKWISLEGYDPNTVDYYLESNKLAKKLATFKRLLIERELWLSDEYRSEEAVNAILLAWFSGMQCTVVYEVGNFQGMVAITNIYPNFKANVTFKIWDKKLWGKELVRAGRELLDLYTEQFRLKRIGTETADPQVVKLAKLFGFTVEGESPCDFMWDKQLYTRYILGRQGV